MLYFIWLVKQASKEGVKTVVFHHFSLPSYTNINQENVKVQDRVSCVRGKYGCNLKPKSRWHPLNITDMFCLSLLTLTLTFNMLLLRNMLLLVYYRVNFYHRSKCPCHYYIILYGELLIQKQASVCPRYVLDVLSSRFFGQFQSKTWTMTSKNQYVDALSTF